MSLLLDSTGDERIVSAFDRLFLVYYPLPAGFNGNKWGVTAQSIDRNINSAIGKPVVIYRKNPNNPLHAHQAGNFIHPTPQEAALELGHNPNAQDYYQWQEKFAVGRVHSVNKRPKGYAFTLEITDPEAKNILKSDAYANSLPGWTSPQILSNGFVYPQEEQSGVFNHWSIAHIALVDSPAYGFDQSAARAKCFGAEKDCLITTRSASQENLGFCVRAATIDLIDSRSSHNEQTGNDSHSNMSTNQTGQGTATGETITYYADQQTQQRQQPTQKKAETSEEIDESIGKRQRETPAGQEEGNTTNQPEVINPETEAKIQGPKSMDEALVQIKQMSELLTEQNKRIKAQDKRLEQIESERKIARLSFIIPRDLFKSDDSHLKEVQKTANENVSEPWLIEYWKTKRELAQAQGITKQMEQPLVAKSASASHEVPQYNDNSSSSNKTIERSKIQKQLELQQMIVGGDI